jgi:hypothetical protein
MRHRAALTAENSSVVSSLASYSDLLANHMRGPAQTGPLRALRVLLIKFLQAQLRRSQCDAHGTGRGRDGLANERIPRTAVVARRTLCEYFIGG